MVALPVATLTALPEVAHEAAPGAGKELGDACADIGAAAVAKCLGLGGWYSVLLLLGRFGGRLGRGQSKQLREKVRNSKSS
jgi:hypothetical protein